MKWAKILTNRFLKSTPFQAKMSHPSSQHSHFWEMGRVTVRVPERKLKNGLTLSCIML